MAFDGTIYDTSVDADRFETLETSTTPITGRVIKSSRVLIVATGADIFIDIGTNPDCTTSYAVVPAGNTGLMFGIHNPGADQVSIRTISGAGWVTIYEI